MREPARLCTFVLPTTPSRGRRPEVTIVGLRNFKVGVPCILRFTLCNLVCLSVHQLRPPAHLQGRCRVGPSCQDKLSAQRRCAADSRCFVESYYVCTRQYKHSHTHTAQLIWGLVRLISRTYSPLSSATHDLELVLLLCLGGLSPAGPCHDCSITDSVRHYVNLRKIIEVAPGQDRGSRTVSLIDLRWLT